MIGPGELVSIIGAVVEAERAVEGAGKQIVEWLNGGPKPDPLPELPDLVANHLAVAAAHRRAELDADAARQQSP